jgi:LysM repeat protein
VTNVSASSPDGIEVSGTVTVCITYLDDEGKPAMAQRQNDYHFIKSFDGVDGKLSCESDVSAVAVSANGRGSALSVKVQLNVRGIVFETHNVSAVSDVCVVNSSKNSHASSITVYFSESGESLWNIAKRYNTSEEAIRRRNSISGDVIETETMLIIPQA